ncbi:MAG: isoprenoid biosynthesis glyoxalase ElbB [Opitutales bacterium]|nr:isoprenoid biosynthesis glyoxalase ElbB [Opitutales bacterium]
MPKVAVVLSGCGYKDGAEIQETVITLLELDKAGVEVQCFAPDIQQEHVVNHLDGQISSYRERSVIEEAARIVRGDIVPLTDAVETEFDALVFPGGFGVAKNLCSFAFDGAACAVDGEVERLILAMHKAGKPIGAICISPALVARVLGAEDICAKVTVGNDKETAQLIRDCGGEHVNCHVDDIVIDEKNNIVSTPAYMYSTTTITRVNAGISKLVKTVLERIK